jgi:hypothetical protein
VARAVLAGADEADRWGKLPFAAVVLVGQVESGLNGFVEWAFLI